MTRTRGRPTAATLLIAALCSVPAITVADAISPPGASGEIQSGRALYARNCAHCHGFDMVSAGGMAYDLREFPHDEKARFVDSVTHGKNNRMPPWGDLLTPQEIDELWAYVKSSAAP